MTIEEIAKLAAGKRAFIVALHVEYYPALGKGTTRAEIYERVSDAISKAVAPFGTVSALRVASAKEIIKKNKD